MRFLLAMFLIAMALQPIDLQGCSMDKDAQASHHTAMQHGDDSPCCDTDADTPMQDCDNAANCSFLSAGFVVIPPTSLFAVSPKAHWYSALNARRHAGPAASPLFRPPIA